MFLARALGGLRSLPRTTRFRFAAAATGWWHSTQVRPLGPRPPRSRVRTGDQLPRHCPHDGHCRWCPSVLAYVVPPPSRLSRRRGVPCRPGLGLPVVAPVPRPPRPDAPRPQPSGRPVAGLDLGLSGPRIRTATGSRDLAPVDPRVATGTTIPTSRAHCAPVRRSPAPNYNVTRAAGCVAQGPFMRAARIPARKYTTYGDGRPLGSPCRSATVRCFSRVQIMHGVPISARRIRRAAAARRRAACENRLAQRRAQILSGNSQKLAAIGGLPLKNHQFFPL